MLKPSARSTVVNCVSSPRVPGPHRAARAGSWASSSWSIRPCVGLSVSCWVAAFPTKCLENTPCRKGPAVRFEEGVPPLRDTPCGHFIFRYPRSHLRNQNKWIFHHKQLDCRPKIPKNLSHGCYCLKIWGKPSPLQLSGLVQEGCF